MKCLKKHVYNNWLTDRSVINNAICQQTSFFNNIYTWLQSIIRLPSERNCFFINNNIIAD